MTFKELYDDTGKLSGEGYDAWCELVERVVGKKNLRQRIYFFLEENWHRISPEDREALRAFRLLAAQT